MTGQEGDPEGDPVKADLTPVPVRRSSSTGSDLPSRPAFSAPPKSASTGVWKMPSPTADQDTAATSAMPAWKKKLLEQKKAAPVENESVTTMPAWKKNLLEKKRLESQAVKPEESKPEWMLKRLQKTESDTAVPSSPATVDSSQPEFLQKFARMNFKKDAEVLEAEGKQDPACLSPIKGVKPTVAASSPVIGRDKVPTPVQRTSSDSKKPKAFEEQEPTPSPASEAPKPKKDKKKKKELEEEEEQQQVAVEVELEEPIRKKKDKKKKQAEVEEPVVEVVYEEPVPDEEAPRKKDKKKKKSTVDEQMVENVVAPEEEVPQTPKKKDKKKKQALVEEPVIEPESPAAEEEPTRKKKKKKKYVEEAEGDVPVEEPVVEEATETPRKKKDKKKRLYENDGARQAEPVYDEDEEEDSGFLDPVTPKNSLRTKLPRPPIASPSKSTTSRSTQSSSKPHLPSPSRSVTSRTSSRSDDSGEQGLVDFSKTRRKSKSVESTPTRSDDTETVTTSSTGGSMEGTHVSRSGLSLPMGAPIVDAEEEDQDDGFGAVVDHKVRPSLRLSKSRREGSASNQDAHGEEDSSDESSSEEGSSSDDEEEESSSEEEESSSEEESVRPEAALPMDFEDFGCHDEFSDPLDDGADAVVKSRRRGLGAKLGSISKSSPKKPIPGDAEESVFGEFSVAFPDSQAVKSVKPRLAAPMNAFAEEEEEDDEDHDRSSNKKQVLSELSAKKFSVETTANAWGAEFDDFGGGFTGFEAFKSSSDERAVNRKMMLEELGDRSKQRSGSSSKSRSRRRALDSSSQDSRGQLTDDSRHGARRKSLDSRKSSTHASSSGKSERRKSGPAAEYFDRSRHSESESDIGFDDFDDDEFPDDARNSKSALNSSQNSLGAFLRREESESEFTENEDLDFPDDNLLQPMDTGFDDEGFGGADDDKATRTRRLLESMARKEADKKPTRRRSTGRTKGDRTPSSSKMKVSAADLQELAALGISPGVRVRKKKKSYSSSDDEGPRDDERRRGRRKSSGGNSAGGSCHGESSHRRRSHSRDDGRDHMDRSRSKDHRRQDSVRSLERSQSRGRRSNSERREMDRSRSRGRRSSNASQGDRSRGSRSRDSRKSDSHESPVDGFGFDGGFDKPGKSECFFGSFHDTEPDSSATEDFSDFSGRKGREAPRRDDFFGEFADDREKEPTQDDFFGSFDEPRPNQEDFFGSFNDKGEKTIGGFRGFGKKDSFSAFGNDPPF